MLQNFTKVSNMKNPKLKNKPAAFPPALKNILKSNKKSSTYRTWNPLALNKTDSPPYHFYLLHGHLDISREITTKRSSLYIASSRTQKSLKPLIYKRKLLITKLLVLNKTLHFINTLNIFCGQFLFDLVTSFLYIKHYTKYVTSNDMLHLICYRYYILSLWDVLFLYYYKEIRCSGVK